MERTALMLGQLMCAAPGDGAQPARQALGMFALLSMTALWIVSRVGVGGMALWLQTGRGDFAERMRAMYSAHRARCILVGLVNLFVGVFIGLALLNVPPLALFGVLLLLFMLLLAVVGYSALYDSVGTRFAGEGEANRARRVLLGGLMCETAFLLPVLGPMVSLALVFRGVGAAVLTVLSLRKEEMPATPGTTDNAGTE